jgi:transposase
MNTKLHAICDSQGRPLNLFVTAGQVRWNGCRPPQTASQCAKFVVFKATRRGGQRNEEYDDWG